MPPPNSVTRGIGRFTPRALMCAVVALVATIQSPIGIASDDSPPRGSKLFVQMANVLQHPRCMNCHSGESFPRQGDDAHRHRVNVSRGPADRGAAGLHCGACHQSANQDMSGVPGAPSWQLAPMRMKWTGLTVGELCRALLDPSRGGMVPAQFVPHFQTALVRWAWNPGQDSEGRLRTAPPLAYAEFVELTERWVAAGTPCPP
jgi:hypothetical protein